MCLSCRFNDLVSSAHVLQINRAYNENDIVLMRSKLNIILKLFLVSDVPPKLRVRGLQLHRDLFPHKNPNPELLVPHKSWVNKMPIA